MSKPKNRLFLLDGMALIYRAHFALIRSPIYTSGGMNTSALFGFINTLLDLVKKQEPTHIAVAFDTSHPTMRHEMFPAYKAQRDEMPEDLSLQIPHLKRIVEAFNIPVLECPGWEADDVIGTLAKIADDRGDFETFMVTPDKDFAQLVSERTSIYKPGRQGGLAEILDIEKIRENWEVKEPNQVIDILGLWGDASDNIPGVPGIGEKTAKKLVAAYGSVEGLLENIDKLKGKQKENVENNKEQALLSKKLVTIVLDAPIEVTFDELEITGYNDEKLKELCVEFEFNAIGKRLFGDDYQAGRNSAAAAPGVVEATPTTIADHKKKYQYIRAEDDKARAKLLASLAKKKSFCFDIETDSLDQKVAKIIGVAFSTAAHSGHYVEVPESGGEAVLAEIAELLTTPGIEKIGHNLKFDIGVLHWNGIKIAGPLFDTMLAHSVIEPEQRHRMDYLSERFLNYIPISYDSVFGKKEEATGQMSLFDEVEMSGGTGPDFEAVAQYAAEDADVTWQLAEILRKQLEETNQERVLLEIECPLIPAIVGMEKQGIKVDTSVLEETGVVLEKRINQLQEEVFEAAGTQFNLGSPKQVGEIFFERLKLVEKPKKTKSGQYKTDEQTLSALSHEHEVVKKLLQYREAAKLKSTYVDALPKSIFEKTGHIHTSFHQLMTATGRLASNDPNLQNIPIRSELGREIRKAFVPRSKEFILMAADYSQVELRVMASLCKDPSMIEAFNDGIDIHTATASRVFGVPVDEVVSDMRRTAKMVNFGIIYGISAFGLAQRLGGSVSRSEAGDIIKEYLKQYPGVKEFQEKTIEQAQKDGYVETVTGRRRYLRDINSRSWTVRGTAERTAINTPIQGTAADMIKIAMVRVHNLLEEGGYQSRMLLQVHDELVFDMHRDEAEEVTPKVVDAMKNALPLNVPVVVDTGTGENWLDAH
ncbi:MAG: DNA polymerase I [Verrucomicrobiales bacterium]|nr:DNA polymerase I [Verrucomicrobiales bacterium]